MTEARPVKRRPGHRCLLVALLVLLSGPAWAAPLPKAEVKRLLGELGQALAEGRAADQQYARFRRAGDEARANDADRASYAAWATVPQLILELAPANSKQVWKALVKAAEVTPIRYQAHEELGRAARTMDAPKVQVELRRTALRSRSPWVRRELLRFLVEEQAWETLRAALDDKDELAASLAARGLIDGRVREAIPEMLERLAKLEEEREGIWDVLHRGLGTLLGRRCRSAADYGALWEQLEGGAPLPAGEDQDPGGERPFGRPLDCTRILIVLEVSSAMEHIPAEGDGRTLLARAQDALAAAIAELPEMCRLNLIAYSSRVKMWRSGGGDLPPQLHRLDAKTRASATEFVRSFRADGVCALDTALLRAQDVENLRCIYLVSSGLATHDGKTPIPLEELVNLWVSEGNRHVPVHALGFEGLDGPLLRGLAEASGGTYRELP